MVCSGVRQLAGKEDVEVVGKYFWCITIATREIDRLAISFQSDEVTNTTDRAESVDLIPVRRDRRVYSGAWARVYPFTVII